jgi:thiol:disulfide interchange protein
VRKELERYVLLKIDVSEDTERDRELQDKYGAKQLPQLVLLDPAGREAARVGKVDLGRMLALLREHRPPDR